MTTLSYFALIFLSLSNFIESIPQNTATDLPHFTKLTSDEVRHLQNRGFGPTVPSTYSSPADEEDSSASATQQRHQTYAEENYNYPNVIPIKQARTHLVREQQQHLVPRQKYPQQLKVQIAQEINRQKEEEEEIEEPDRLSLLLPQSKFVCDGKNTGYYADEGLACEVFHYCQENAKHSWICPDGFTFHQIHLICMPPSSDNICAKSSEYHFINDYLYKPVNLEEHEQHPNTSLRYSERYYPDSYAPQDNNDDENQEVVHHKQHSIRVKQQEINVPKPLSLDQFNIRTTFRPDTTLGQVFRSPNEVNIPLQQRRPQYFTQQRYLNREQA